jgi:hypothetical protein
MRSYFDQPSALLLQPGNPVTVPASYGIMGRSFAPAEVVFPALFPYPWS